MTEELWTKGPWTSEPVWAGYTAIRGANGELVFGISMGDSDECQTPETCEANLRMCVAAPTMYEALEAIKGLAIVYAAGYQLEHGLASIHPTHADILSKATAALAKANQNAQEGE